MGNQCFRFSVIPSAIALSVAVNAGCHRPQLHQLSAEQSATVSEIKNMSAPDEFRKNVAAKKIVLYGIGSLSYGYTAPGLGGADIEAYIRSNRVTVELRFVDDPAPIGASNAFWSEAERFVAAYNALMISYIKEKKL